jgi:hypothetical protein
MWHIIQSEATGRYFIVKGYYETRIVWVSGTGASDFINKADAQKQVDVLNNWPFPAVAQTKRDNTPPPLHPAPIEDAPF